MSGDLEQMGREEVKELKYRSVPKHNAELIFLTVNLLFLKLLVSEQFFEAMTFFLICVPILGYLLFSIFSNLYQLLELMHIEALAAESPLAPEEEQSTLISPKQLKRIVRIARDLLLYFGIYFLAGQIDQVLVFKEEFFVDVFLKERRGLLPAALIDFALLLHILTVRSKRQRIIQAKVQAGLLSAASSSSPTLSTALSTLFNALT